jgi:hypothetical protein
MIRVLDRALEVTETLQREERLGDLDRLKAVTRWALETQLASEMPWLPAQNSTLRSTLMSHNGYLVRRMRLSDRLGLWISGVQENGALNARLPPEVCASRFRPAQRSSSSNGRCPAPSPLRTWPRELQTTRVAPPWCATT